MRIILDCETNALKGYTKLHNAVTRDIDTGIVNVFRPFIEEDKQRLRDHLSKATLLVGHNIIGFDLGVLEDFLGYIPDRSIVVDTLVLSRLLDYNRLGGHSLEAWGERFGIKKSKWDDFDEWSQELEDRCISDTDINLSLYNHFARHLESPRWSRSIRLEHDLAFLCVGLNKTGFYFNLGACKELKEKLYNTIVPLEEQFSNLFPPLVVPLKEITPKATLKGTIGLQDFRWLKGNEKGERDLTVFSPDCPFTLFDYLPFNPASVSQIVHRMNLAGWKPVNKTKGHIEAERNKEDLTEWRIKGWKVDEENLATLPDTAPEGAKKLAEYLLMKSRVSDLEEWENLCTPLPGSSKGILHGTFNGIGSWTQRMSHQAPNMANIPALVNRKGKPQYLGREMRSLFLASSSVDADGMVRHRKLVGVDADAIQLRVFAHIVNDPVLINALVNGRKEDASDAHSINKGIIERVVKCEGREVAKTYLYALFLGAGTAKQSEILSCTKSEARAVERSFMAAYPGWKELKDSRIPQDAGRGYFEGLDGRLVRCTSEHLMLAGYLQNGEKVVMARAATLMEKTDKVDKKHWDLVNFVHDELQYDVDEEYAQQIGEMAMYCIVRQGQLLELNCPLAANMKVGNDWSETH